MVRQGLRKILESHAYANIAEAGNSIETMEALQRCQPDVILMDIGLPGIRGIELATEIITRYPAIRIIFITMHKDEEYVYQAMSTGVAGYLLKDCTESEVVFAIQSVLKGKTYLTPMISTQLVNVYAGKSGSDYAQSTFNLLTNREREILAFIGEGKSNQVIADTLFISARTVEHHRQNLMKKLNVASLPELIKLAIKNKLIAL